MINELKPAMQHLREAQQTVLGFMELLVQSRPKKTIVLNSHAYLLFALWQDRDRPHVAFDTTRRFRGCVVICNGDDIADGIDVRTFDVDRDAGQSSPKCRVLDKSGPSNTRL